jgi:hypothetical protein
MKAPVNSVKGPCSPTYGGGSGCKTWAALTDVGKLDRWELCGGDG